MRKGGGGDTHNSTQTKGRLVTIITEPMSKQGSAKESDEETVRRPQRPPVISTGRVTSASRSDVAATVTTSKAIDYRSVLAGLAQYIVDSPECWQTVHKVVARSLADPDDGPTASISFVGPEGGRYRLGDGSLLLQGLGSMFRAEDDDDHSDSGGETGEVGRDSLIVKSWSEPEAKKVSFKL